MQLSHVSVGVMENRVSVMVPEKGTRHSNLVIQIARVWNMLPNMNLLL